VFGVSHQAIWVRLGWLAFTLKKKLKISRAQRGAAVALPARTGKAGPPPPFSTWTNAAWITACIVSLGRTPRGERIHQEVAGARRERTRIIAASQQGKLAAPLVWSWQRLVG